MKEITLDINGKDYKVTVDNFGVYEANVTVNGRKYKVGLKDLGVEQVVEVQNKTAAAPKAPQVASAPQAAAAPVATAGGSTTVTAPLPGLILKINVKVGDTVSAGQVLMIMEAMKMENDVEATAAGTVKSIAVKENDNVAEGDVLITIG